MKAAIVILIVLTFDRGAESLKKYISESTDSSEYGGASGPAQTSCPCGWTNKARVVGGKETLSNEYPLMLGVVHVESSSVFCGASVLTRRHALTAAHCTEPVKGEELQVVAGAHDLYQGGQHDTVVPVKETIEHEDYSPLTFVNDIALLVLEEPLNFNQYIGPVCMPSQSYSLVNKHLKLIGWGKTSTGGETSEVLLKVNLKVVPLTDCERTYRNHNPIDVESPKQICTFRRGKDSCQGDSGGPLLWLDEATNRYTQVGLVSFGRECGGDDPAVNTDVFSYVHWIKRKIEDSKDGGELCQRL